MSEGRHITARTLYLPLAGLHDPFSTPEHRDSPLPERAFSVPAVAQRRPRPPFPPRPGVPSCCDRHDHPRALPQRASLVHVLARFARTAPAAALALLVIVVRVRAVQNVIVALALRVIRIRIVIAEIFDSLGLPSDSTRSRLSSSSSSSSDSSESSPTSAPPLNGAGTSSRRRAWP